MAKDKLVNEGKIDHDLMDIDNQIATLMRRREVIEESKKYLLSIGASKEKEPTKKTAQPADKNQNNDEDLTPFILDLLKGGKKNTSSIITAWATKTNKKYEDVGRNVSKRLAQLKKSEKITNEVSEKGSKYGSVWSLK